MRRVFRFGSSSSFHGGLSQELAEVIRDAPVSVQRQLIDSLGLRVGLSASGYHRMQHDGRKVGIGSFGSVHIVVAPKIDSLRLQAIFQALGGSPATSRHVSYENLEPAAPVEGESDDFSPAVLIALLDQIARDSVHLLNASHRKEIRFVQGGVRGRPVLDRSVIGIYLGRRLGFFCELLDEYGLRYHAMVLLETARSIAETLDEWHELVPTEARDYQGKMRYVVSKFGSVGTGLFNRSLLYAVCRPPFPYGLRDVLYRCLRYWQWRGAFRVEDQGKESFGYRSFSVQLNLLFQDYVDECCRASLDSGFSWTEPQRYSYTVTGLEGGARSKHLLFDHHVVYLTTGTRFVFDAKYTHNICAEADIYQVNAYLSYEFATQGGRKIGILTYPGDSWKTGKISGFEHELYWVQMPVTPQLRHPELKLFVSSLLESASSPPAEISER